MPLWMCSWPARAQNSSMRALTSWRVTSSRRGDGREIHHVPCTLIGLHCPQRHIQAEVALNPEHGYPKLAFKNDSSRRRLDIFHGARGVAFRENVHDGFCHGSGVHPAPKHHPCQAGGPQLFALGSSAGISTSCGWLRFSFSNRWRRRICRVSFSFSASMDL